MIEIKNKKDLQKLLDQHFGQGAEATKWSFSGLLRYHHGDVSEETDFSYQRTEFGLKNSSGDNDVYYMITKNWWRDNKSVLGFVEFIPQTIVVDSRAFRKIADVMDSHGGRCNRDDFDRVELSTGLEEREIIELLRLGAVSYSEGLVNDEGILEKFIELEL